jgi:hypothetical protein
LKPEEDEDKFGGKGHYLASPAFSVNFVSKQQGKENFDLVKFANDIHLDTKNLVFIKINP